MPETSKSNSKQGPSSPPTWGEIPRRLRKTGLFLTNLCRRVMTSGRGELYRTRNPLGGDDRWDPPQTGAL